MNAYDRRNIAGSMSVLLAGLTCFSGLGGVNTSVEMINYTPPAVISTYDNYGTESVLLKPYALKKNKFRVEIEAEALFGEMREATKEERESIENGLKKISKKTGVNFWTYV